MKIESCEPLLSWTVIDGVQIPSFKRKGCEYIPVRLAESTLLSQYPSSQELRDSPLDGQLMTAAESAALNSAASDELVNSVTALDQYSTKDLVVKLTDFLGFYQRVKDHFGVDDMTGGWLQLNNVVMPYVIRDNSKVIPLDIIRIGGQILTDADLREYELIPSESERVFLNNSFKLCGFDYRLEANVSKLVDLTVVWLYCSLNSTKLTVRELPGKDPISEAGYDDDDVEDDDHASESPSPILSDDSGIEVAGVQKDVKPILIKPIERSDSIICLLDDESSEKEPSCQDSTVEGSLGSNDASASEHLQPTLEPLCPSEQPPVSKVSKRKRAAPTGSKKGKSKQRKVSEKLPAANTTQTTSQKETPTATVTSPARDADNSRTMSFENSDFAGRQPMYPSAQNSNYAANFLNECLSTGKPYRQPFPGIPCIQPPAYGQYQRRIRLNSQRISLPPPPPPLAAISGTNLPEAGTDNSARYHPYDTASRAKANLNPSSPDAGFCANGSGMVSQRSVLPQQQNVARVIGHAEPYYREPMMRRNPHRQNLQIPSQHTSGTDYYENNYIMRQLQAQGDDSDIRSRPIDGTSLDVGINNASVNTNQITRPPDGNRIMHSPGYDKSVHANVTPFYQDSTIGCPPGTSYVPPIANGVGIAVANGLTGPGMIRVRNGDQLQSVSGAYQIPAHQIPPAVHGVVPCTRPGNSESQFHVPARQNTENGSHLLMSSVQQQQLARMQQQSARKQYLNSQSVSNAGRMLEMHQSAARQVLHRAQVSTGTYGYGVPRQPNTTVPAVPPTRQVDSRAFQYSFTKPWRVLATLANRRLILTVRVVGKEVACLMRHDGIHAPLESLHESLFAEYYSLDDWLYMMYVTFGANTSELSDEEERAFGICRSKTLQCKRAISLPEFYKHLEHFGMR